MTVVPRSLNYEKLARSELDAAASAVTIENRNAHLNQAAIYALVDERLRPGSPHAAEVEAVIGRLSAILEDVDTLCLTEAAIHVNDAIIALGGTGISPRPHHIPVS